MLFLIIALNVSFNNVQAFMGFISFFFFFVATVLKLRQAAKKKRKGRNKNV